MFRKSQKINFIATYDAGDGFCVDIIETTSHKFEVLEAWLYLEEIGIKSLMFGIPRNEVRTTHEFLEIVEDLINDYIGDYTKEYLEKFAVDVGYME